MPKQLNKFEELKRNVYLWILPLLIFGASISVWYIGDTKQANVYMLQLLLVVFSVSWLLLYTKRWYKLVEFTNLIIVSIIHLVKSFDIVYSLTAENYSQMSSGTYWTPLIYIFIFVALKGKSGLIYSLFLWSVTLLFGVYYWSEVPQVFIEQVFHYYLANLVYIIFMFFASFIISAFTESEMLEKFAYQDSLTGIANRRRVYQWLDDAILKNKVFSVIFFDLDHFKKINDENGHLVGDKILIELASLMVNHLPMDSHLGRWGGEEFIIISFNNNKEDALGLAETCRQTIQSHAFTNGNSITSSFGVAVYRHGDTTETLIDRADEALYRSKQQGRNQVS